LFKNGSSIIMALGLRVLALKCKCPCSSVLRSSGGWRSAWKPSTARPLAHGRTPQLLLTLTLHSIMLLLLAIIQQLCGRLHHALSRNGRVREKRMLVWWSKAEAPLRPPRALVLVPQLELLTGEGCWRAVL